VICYTSFKKSYEVLMKRLVNTLRERGFSGDILYRVGGWPNLQGGGILLCDVPYAFKISAFEEALQLGYSSALWLDTSIVPLTNLEDVFRQIEENTGYFRKALQEFKQIRTVTADLAESMGLSLEELYEVTHCATGVLGLNLKDSNVQKLLEDWHAYAESKKPFCSSFPEQVPFSVLVKKYELSNGMCSPLAIALKRIDIGETTQFLVAY